MHISDVDSPLVSAKNWRPSPNWGERAEGYQIDMLVLHYTATETAVKALYWLTAEQSEVSSHYLIDGEGEIFQLGARARARLACGGVLLGGGERS